MMRLWSTHAVEAVACLRLHALYGQQKLFVVLQNGHEDVTQRLAVRFQNTGGVQDGKVDALFFKCLDAVQLHAAHGEQILGRKQHGVRILQGVHRAGAGMTALCRAA